MKLLPKQQDSIVAEKFPLIMERIKEGDIVVLGEPCDCGSQIRHNNGGNYHEVVSFALDKDNKWYMKYDTTCELTPPAEWDEKPEKDAVETIKSLLREGYS